MCISLIFEVGCVYIVTKRDGSIIVFTFVGGEPPMVEVNGEILPLSEVLKDYIKIEKKLTK